MSNHHNGRTNKSKSSSLEAQLKARQQQFGVDYISLVEMNAPSKELIACLEKTMEDLAEIKKRASSATAAQNQRQRDARNNSRSSPQRQDSALSPPMRSNSDEGLQEMHHQYTGDQWSTSEDGDGADDNEEDDRRLPAEEEAAMHAATTAAAIGNNLREEVWSSGGDSETDDDEVNSEASPSEAEDDDVGTYSMAVSRSSSLPSKERIQKIAKAASMEEQQKPTSPLPTRNYESWSSGDSSDEDEDIDNDSESSASQSNGSRSRSNSSAAPTQPPSNRAERKRTIVPVPRPPSAEQNAVSSQPTSKRAERTRTVVPAPPPPSSEQTSKNNIRQNRNRANKLSKSASVRRKRNDGFQAGNEDNPFQEANPYLWQLNEYQFSGRARYETRGKQEKITGKSIEEGIEHFKANPEEYVAMLYETKQFKEHWPTSLCEYIYVHRKGTSMYQPTGISETGWMTILIQEYEALPSYENNCLPMKYRDKYTDHMTFKGHKLHSDKNPPILPGRKMGVCDAPNIKVIGDVDPSDIRQGKIGDCWLLSGLSSLAEFDGAIKYLFRKTRDLHKLPREKPNKYIVTLWDVETWKEVDIEIDERLPAASNGGLLASKPSADGELWACYLEKAFAIHAGGWDKIVGGQCSHAWAVCTGCKWQYIITETKPGSRRWHCALRYKESEDKWGKHANSPHDCDGLYYKARWPEVGGGGGKTDITEDELFEKMCAWDDINYIMGAGTTGESDENTTGGMVDNHAYSVIDCFNDVGGTPIDLIKVRNPWGKGEIEDGEFDDDGPGWDEWPQVKAELNPVVADDGIFYVTPSEFFRFFGTIFLSASDMTEFLED